MGRGAYRISFLLAACTMLVTGCDDSRKTSQPASISTVPASELTGRINISVGRAAYPLAEVLMRDFRRSFPNVTVSAQTESATGVLHDLCNGESQVAIVARKLKPADWRLSASRNIDVIELAIAKDAVAIVVNGDNGWVDQLSTRELKDIWSRDSRVKTWRDVRPDWPDRPLRLYGRPLDDGATELLAHAICGDAAAIRADYVSQADAHVLAPMMARDLDALGFMGTAWFEMYKDRLKCVPVASAGQPAMPPSVEAIRDGTYRPLSRIVYLHVNKRMADRPEVAALAEFCLRNARVAASELGYSELPEWAYGDMERRLTERRAGADVRKSGRSIDGAEDGPR